MSGGQGRQAAQGAEGGRSLSISISNSITLLNWNIPTGISICGLTLHLLHMFLYSIRNIFYSIRNNYSKRNIPYGIIIPSGIFFYSIRNNYSSGNIFYSIRNIIPSGIFSIGKKGAGGCPAPLRFSVLFWIPSSLTRLNVELSPNDDPHPIGLHDDASMR